MTFGTLLPLIALVGVPIIIILYLMKPKGVRKVVPSLLLWKNAEKNERSVTFSKKLIRNILMILEILALLLLMLAAMSPAIKRGGMKTGASTVIVIDNSGSMGFIEKNGKTRLANAISDAKDYVDMCSGDISVMVSSNTSEVLVSSSKDKQKIKRLLSDVKITDKVGDISKAEGLIQSLNKKDTIVFTDAQGAEKLESIADRLKMDIKVYGDKDANVGLTQVSLKRNADSKYDISVGYNVTGSENAVFEVSLYDEKGGLLEVRNIDTTEKEGNTILMTGKDVRGKFVRAELSSIHFTDDKGKETEQVDGLSRDNKAYGVLTSVKNVEAYLVGAGNIYFEKAYIAATGDSIIKKNDDSDIEEKTGGALDTTLAIYDKAELVKKDVPRIVQQVSPQGCRVLDGAIVTVRTGGLIQDMSEFYFGANELSVLECPDWAEPLMTARDTDGVDNVVAYYGENAGIRQIVLGFDVRNSEFPLMAEFPIMVADSISYLTQDSLLQSEYIQAGDSLGLSPSVSSNMKIERLDDRSASPMDESGVYRIQDKSADGSAREEYFVVRYPFEEMDGSGDAESMSYVKSPEYGVRFSSLKRICLILVLILLIIDWIIYARRNRVKRGLDLYVRVVLILLVLLAGIGISLPGRKRGTATIFVVDLSDSNKLSLDKEQQYLRDTIAGMPKGDQYGVVTFGGNVLTDQFLTDDTHVMDIASVPDGKATDIEGAVNYAASLIPDNKKGRIVVLTDGKETLGDINGVKSRIEIDDIELCGMLFESSIGKDVYIQYVDMPEKLKTGDKYKLKVTVFSNYETAATLKLYTGSEITESTAVSLVKGENTFELIETAGDKAVEERRVVIEANGDTIEDNNSVIAAAVVESPDSVLLISGMNEDSSGFESLLKSQNINVTTVSAINAPDSLIGMLEYKTIVIDNTYVTDLPEGFVNSVETYVKDYGGGLIVTGGNESFALGGYKDTPLETVLPVEMTPESINEAPSLALVMVIDCSGSMEDDGTGGVTMNPNAGGGRRKIDVAVDAAMEAVDALTRQDQVGVLTFSDNFSWRQPITYIDDKDAIKSEISKIGIDGGTTIKPAVVEAARRLAKVDAANKHIILLTDGQGETSYYDDVIKEINDNGITLSSVAVGEDSDTTLLESLAENCNGRYYFSSTSTDVPKIFTEEVYLSGETFFKNGEFKLHVNTGNKLVSGLYSDGIGMITGYIATSMKSGAREVISSDEDQPILASWQYGLGHTIAWTTNASGTWNEALTNQDDYAEMWKRCLDYAGMQSNVGQDNVSVYKRRDRLEVTYLASEYSEDTSVTGVYTAPSGATGQLQLMAGEPGSYSASFVPTEMGVYTISVRRSEAGKVVAATTSIETIQFSDEYKTDISNAEFTRFVDENGRLLKDGDKVFTKVKSANNSRRDITTLLIVISLVLLILDIVVRRFDVASRVNKAVKKYRAEKETQKQANNASEDEKTGEIHQEIKEPVKKPKALKQPKSSKKDAGQTATALDTSALLQKKKDRNNWN